MARVFLGVGTNEGDRLDNLSRAVHRLAASGAARLVRMATIAETKPIGGPPQADFLNTVLEIETVLSPHELLASLKGIEDDMGRSPSVERWGPRLIDLDILLYEDRVINEPQLVVPHPQMHTRRFVLEPLAQLAPEVVHPVLKRTIEELLHACDQARA